VFGLVVFATFVDPRPYFVTDIDAEQDYYYNARLILSGLPTTVHHPGTPVQYLTSALLALNGEGLEVVQRFFNSAYIVTAVLTSLAFLGFGALVGRGASPGVVALALTTILAWPPVPTYLTMLGIDSFIVAAGLPTIALFWHTLEHGGRPRRVLLALGGAGIGLCLAIKMSFLPVAVALSAGYLIWAIRSAPPGTDGILPTIRRLTPVVAGGVVGYLLAIAPVLERIGVIWEFTLKRPDVQPAGGSLWGDFGSAMRLVVDAAPGWTLLLAATLVVSVAALARPAARPPKAGSAPKADLDFVAAAVFLGLMAAGFFYTTSASTTIMPESEPGIRLRNITPTALAMPFAVLFAWALAARRSPDQRPHRRQVEVLLFGTAAVVVLSVFTRYLGARHDFVEQRLRRIAATETRLAQLAPPSARIAFWTESSQDYLGAASFHFWGNYRYANHAYDRLLLDWFPRYTLLRLRNIRRMPDTPTGPAPDPPPSRYGWIGEVVRKLTTGRPHYSTFPGALAGEGSTGPVKVLAMPEVELHEMGKMSEAEVAAKLHRVLGAASPWREDIGGVTWLLFNTVPRGVEARITAAGLADPGSEDAWKH
jgi:hypothetical protein